MTLIMPNPNEWSFSHRVEVWTEGEDCAHLAVNPESLLRDVDEKK